MVRVGQRAGADLIREPRRDVRLSRTRSAPTGEEDRVSRQPVGAGPARDSRAGRAPTGEWHGWGSVGADLIREPRRDVRLSRTRSAPTGEEYRISRQPVGAGPARDSRAGRAPTWNGAGGAACRSGSHPRIAPGRPAIADKVRSYGGGTLCFPATCRALPAIRAQGALLHGMAQVGTASRRSELAREQTRCHAVREQARSYEDMKSVSALIQPPQRLARVSLRLRFCALATLQLAPARNCELLSHCCCG